MKPKKITVYLCLFFSLFYFLMSASYAYMGMLVYSMNFLLIGNSGMNLLILIVFISEIRRSSMITRVKINYLHDKMKKEIKKSRKKVINQCRS